MATRNEERMVKILAALTAATPAMTDFLILIKPHPVVTLLYASKEPVYNHARILRDYLEMRLKE